MHKNINNRYATINQCQLNIVVANPIASVIIKYIPIILLTHSTDSHLLCLGFATGSIVFILCGSKNNKHITHNQGLLKQNHIMGIIIVLLIVKYIRNKIDLIIKHLH